MSTIQAQASLVIDAKPADIYAVLADYHIGHPAILPKPYFEKIEVEEGGKGSGTVIRVYMNVMGNKRIFREVVSEPEPGRVLVETDPDSGVTTTFIVAPLNDGKQAEVTIATMIKAAPGIMGMIEKLTTPMITRRIFKQELQQLADYMRGH